MDEEMGFHHDKEYHDIVNNKDVLRRCTEALFYNIMDELTLGIILDMHKMHKKKCYDMDTIGTAVVDKDLLPNVDIFGQYNIKKMQECECPNCHASVAATRFAPHLEKCMGMGRTSTRKPSRRIANNNNNSTNNSNSKERDSFSYSGMPSDDEDDVDWNTGDKRRKKKHRNGTKKGKGTPKKMNSESESMEAVNVDIEGDEDGDVTLREFLQNDSNHSSPVDPITGGNSSKRKDKLKSKKNSKHDRKSPSTSIGE